MKKWILCILFSMNAYAQESLVDEWKNLHFNSEEHLVMDYFEFRKPIQIIYKIEESKDIERKNNLLTLLDLYLDDMFLYLNYLISSFKNGIVRNKETIKKSTDYRQIKDSLKEIEDSEKQLIKYERSLEIVQEWKEKYLNPKSEELMRGE